MNFDVKTRLFIGRRRSQTSDGASCGTMPGAFPVLSGSLQRRWKETAGRTSFKPPSCPHWFCSLTVHHVALHVGAGDEVRGHARRRRLEPERAFGWHRWHDDCSSELKTTYYGFGEVKKTKQKNKYNLAPSMLLALCVLLSVSALMWANSWAVCLLMFWSWCFCAEIFTVWLYVINLNTLLFLNITTLIIFRPPRVAARLNNTFVSLHFF